MSSATELCAVCGRSTALLVHPRATGQLLWLCPLCGALNLLDTGKPWEPESELTEAEPELEPTAVEAAVE